ncbi:uncharacterized protein LOC120656261 isoform X2 [Panicum virgatum]|uniref:uncharacterized protein LOC120656261 isoform X2 n=1 Tax=Panicum virgatum TaxID=38727 RepID=UPI0019D4F5C1|nr:uncharacterized protein LOC120656261 isoform X2 [Panicum virgatum]
MDKFLVAAPPHSGEEPAPPPPPPPRRHRWRRIAVELDGRIDARFRHRESRLLLDSFAEIGAFDHKYYMHGEEWCRTYVDRMISASTMNFLPAREGISAIEFDKKGIYLASVTFSGCLTVHDFETLYCSIYGQSRSIPDDSSNYVLHISNRISLNAVRWNPENQDEIACTSSQSDKVFLFDIGYVSSAPTEVLQKGKSKFPALYSESRKSLTDIAFTSDEKSRIFASCLDGAVYMWDRRSSKTHCLELMAPPESQFNTVKISVDNRVQQLSSVKVSTLLGKIASLKEQSNIVSSAILSIDFNPSCSYQLAFHLDDGWSGVLNINNLSVTHLHCPPPAWLESTDLVLQKQLRKPTWLPTSSIYAVGSSSNDGIYLLDFHPDMTSACHVDKEETGGLEENQPVENKLVPLSQRVLSCAAHPLSHTIIAGTQYSSLLILSQKHETVRNLES